MATTSALGSLASTICQTDYYRATANNMFQHMVQYQAQSLRPNPRYQNSDNDKYEIWEWFKEERDMVLKRESARCAKTFEDYL